MKFHWGAGVFFFYGLFVLGILSAVLFYMGQDLDLVSQEYYTDGIKYQDKIEKLERTNELKENVKFIQADEKLTIAFPKTARKITAGEILFMRPSDRNYDFRLPLKTDQNLLQLVDFHGKSKGLWKIEVNWKTGNTEYMSEETVNIK